MRCPKCKVINKPNANFCINCGISFKEKQILTVKRLLWLVSILVIILCSIIFLISSLYTTSNKKAEVSHNTDNKVKRDISKNIIGNKLSKIDPPIIIVAKQEKLVNRPLSIQKNSDDLSTLKRYSEKILRDNNKEKKLIINRIIQLSTVNISRGHSNEVASILNINVIAASDNVQLLKYAVNLRLNIYGYGSALNFIENLKYSSMSSNTFHNGLSDLENSIYIDWVNDLITKNKISDALDVYDFAIKNTKADSNLLILGAVIYLEENEWQKAEKIVNIIKSGNYNIPNGFTSIERQIKYFKSIEGKIVLRFNPGSNYIPAEAILDNEIGQKFIVDTGASLVTIPKATADQLNLRYASGNKTRMVATAGGTVYAREVIISSITINNKTARDIPALIMDLPNHGSLGLLGLSYLNRFHLQVNNSKGEMILTPK